MGKTSVLAVWAHVLGLTVAALSVDTREEILKSASAVAGDLLALYDGNKSGGTPGRWNDNSGYVYWEGSIFVGALMDYWHLTNDSTYNDVAKEALLFQAGDNSFLPSNLMPSYITNGDQCSWALAAMQAAEDKFPVDAQRSWVSIAQTVFDQQKARLDGEDKVCEGGLRTGITNQHHAYGWKDSQSNGCFFNLAARLGRYTGNTTYSEAAVKAWDWMTKREFIQPESFRVVYGAPIRDGSCSTPGGTHYSIDGALVAEGAAFMFNQTNGSDEWRTRVDKLTASILKDYFPSNTAFEPECEVQELCNSNVLAYKGAVIRSMAAVIQLAPSTTDSIMKAFKDTARAMANGCKNGETGRKCQFYWLDIDPELILDEDDPKTTGVGEQMNALSAFSNLFVREAAAPAVAPTPMNSPRDGNSPTGEPGSGSGSGSGSGETKEGAGNRLLGSPSLLLVAVGLFALSWL